MPTQGSCLPWVSISTSLPSASAVRIGCKIELVGLTAKRMTMSCPVEMPPRMPPALFDRNTTAPSRMRISSPLSPAPRARGPDAGAVETPLHRLDRHHGAGEVAVELVVDRLAEPGRDAARHHLDDRAGRGALLVHGVEIVGPVRRHP